MQGFRDNIFYKISPNHVFYWVQFIKKSVDGLTTIKSDFLSSERTSSSWRTNQWVGLNNWRLPVNVTSTSNVKIYLFYGAASLVIRSGNLNGKFCHIRPTRQTWLKQISTYSVHLNKLSLANTWRNHKLNKCVARIKRRVIFQLGHLFVAIQMAKGQDSWSRVPSL